MATPIQVAKSDKACFECGGQLTVVDADDISLTVVCEDCGEEWRLESDGLGDGGVEYWPRMMAAKLDGGCGCFGE